MRRAHWTEGGIELTEDEPGPLREGWVRLRVHACGICGTDLHLWRRELPAPAGGVPGHEVVGLPLDGGRGLPDRLYAVEPRTWCGACDLCISGSRHLCAKSSILGLGLPGGLADWIDAPREAVHPVDASVSAGAAAIAEPLAVCVRALHLARPEASSRVLVLGAGNIGLLCGLLARDRADEVAITARYDHQRRAAERLGILPLAEGAAADWALERGPDLVIETVGGGADTLEQAVRLCRPAGRVVVLGVFGGSRPIDALALMAKEIEVVGSNTYGTGRRGPEFRVAVDLLPRYRSELEPLQTHRFSLDAVADAFACAADKKSGAIKVTVLP